MGAWVEATNDGRMNVGGQTTEKKTKETSGKK